METKKYAIYKGLQRPLIFKMFKGKFIYWGAGSIIAGIVTGGIIAATVSSLAGLITLAVVSIPLLMYTLKQQSKGLSDKKLEKFIYIIKPKHTVRHELKKNI